MCKQRVNVVTYSVAKANANARNNTGGRNGKVFAALVISPAKKAGNNGFDSHTCNDYGK